MKPFGATWKAIGEVLPSPAPQQARTKLRTTTDGFAGDGEDRPSEHSGKSAFNFGRHRWLGLVARDAKLPGAAHRVAVVLWQLQNCERGCAWPSLEYIAAELKMHRSTVLRSLHALRERRWITITHRGGRHRTNEYRISFGLMDEGHEALEIP
jgi:hypothetical protein